MAAKRVSAAVAYTHAADHQCNFTELTMNTTPLLALYRRFLPDWLAYPALALTYASLIVLNIALFFPPDVFNMVYLDVGRQ